MKRLIYPKDYYGDIFDNKMIGIFSGIDIRTDEEVFSNIVQYPSEDLEIPEFFKENDVLFMEYGKSGDFPIVRVANRKATYDEVKRAYLRMRTKCITEQDINDMMIEKYNYKPVKTKRMYKK